MMSATDSTITSGSGSGSTKTISWLPWVAAGIGVLATAGLGYWYYKKKARKHTRALEYIKNSPVVVIDYEDLLQDNIDLSIPLETAFGFNGLGVIAVRGVPNFAKLRQDLLPQAFRFATLPDQVKEKYVHKESLFSFGWSHGKEKLDGKPDFSKGSYYNNPNYDRPFDDEKIKKEYPTYAYPNIWPKKDLPELEPAFKAMGQLITDVGIMLAVHCDRYVHSRLPGYSQDKLRNIIRNSRTNKARLLHYFALDEESINYSHAEKEDDYGSWCGWHNDHGSLTGLVPGMYINAEGKEVPNPDPEHAGLYIRSRQGNTVKAVWPADYLAFQMGEAEQIHSGGVLRATPHCVRAARGAKSKGVSRESFAVFMQPMWDEPMALPPGATQKNAKHGSSKMFMPPGVPALEDRWNPKLDFGQFTTLTVEKYTIY